VHNGSLTLCSGLMKHQMFSGSTLNYVKFESITL